MTLTAAAPGLTARTDSITPPTPLPLRRPSDTGAVTQVMFSTLPARSSRRPQLRLVADDETSSIVVHGVGGPDSCSCRACSMARHPSAAGPRLRVVR